MQNIVISTCNKYRISLMRHYTFSHNKSLKSVVYFTLIAHLNSNAKFPSQILGLYFYYI